MSLVALPARAANVGVSAGVGTLGAGLGLTFGVTERFNGRVGFGNFSDDVDFEEGDFEYEGEATLGGIYGLVDFHPTGGGFRLSAGLVLNNNELTGDAEATTGFVEIGGVQYPAAAVGTLSASTEFDDVAPYLGIGWGNGASGERGFTFSFDLGVMFQGDVAFDLQSSTPLVDQDDLDREAEALAKEVDEAVSTDAFPVIAVGIGYAF
jgi:hypothetical protein